MYVTLGYYSRYNVVKIINAVFEIVIYKNEEIKINIVTIWYKQNLHLN